jgi:hypothetical protein
MDHIPSLGLRAMKLFCQRKERSQEEAGFLLALRGEWWHRRADVGVGWARLHGPAGQNLSLSCSRAFAGITSSHPCYSTLEPLSLWWEEMHAACQTAGFRGRGTGYKRQQSAQAKAVEYLVTGGIVSGLLVGKILNWQKCKNYNASPPGFCKNDILDTVPEKLESGPNHGRTAEKQPR